MKIGITGSNGFIGWHLKNRINFTTDEFHVVRFDREFFNNKKSLVDFISECDVVVHLASINRHIDEDFLYSENIRIANSLLSAISEVEKTPVLINASSVQQDLENKFGKSKKKVVELFRKSSNDLDFKFINLVIPNVFGPFCKPNYNSFISTFCHNIVNGNHFQVSDDRHIDVLYIDDLIEVFFKIFFTIRNIPKFQEIKIFKIYNILISDVPKILLYFSETYLQKGEIPYFNNDFEKKLFTTFRSFLSKKNLLKKIKKHEDERGTFSEMIRSHSGGQTSISTSYERVVRGNHFHTRKIERFYVLQGVAKVQIRKVSSNDVIEFILDSELNQYLDIPVWYTHNIINIGNEKLITAFWINEHYDENKHDTYILDVI